MANSEKNNTDFYFEFELEGFSYSINTIPVATFDILGIDDGFTIGFWLRDTPGDGWEGALPKRVAFARRLAQLIKEGFFENFTEAELDVTNLGSDLS